MCTACYRKVNDLFSCSASCQFHPGQPVFHDALKGWSCCNKRSTDFTEFLNFKVCTYIILCSMYIYIYIYHMWLVGCICLSWLLLLLLKSVMCCISKPASFWSTKYFSFLWQSSFCLGFSNWVLLLVLLLVGAEILWAEEGSQLGFKRWQGSAVSKVLWEWIPNNYGIQSQRKFNH